MKLYVARLGTGELFLSSKKPKRIKMDKTWFIPSTTIARPSFILLPKNHQMGENLVWEDEPREVLLVAKVGYESLMNIRSCNICVNFEGSWEPGTWIDTKCFECRRMSNFE